MIPRLIHHLYALLFLGIGSVVYQNLVTPLTEPPEVQSVAPKSVAAGTTNDEAVADLFAENAWQRGNCKKLQSSTGMLMYSHWERISDVQWKLWPVSVVLGRGLNADPTADPVILDAPQGAEITFTESLDMLSGGAPPISNGRLIGKVEIRRNDSKDAKNSLSIRTANVGIDSRKVWTTEAIEMNLGQAEMIGRDLTIHFSGPTVSGPGGAGGSETVLDRMELIYLDQMVMPLEEGGLLKSKPNQKAELSIQCGGRVEYDFALDELSLRDSVSFLHEIDGAAADQFLCDTLMLKLRDPTNDSVRRDTPLDWVNRIVAKGQPARALLPSFDAELSASVLDFDAVSGLIHATGGRNGVRVKRGGVDATLAQLTYQFDPNRPKAIGLINVQGAGIVRMNDPEVPLSQVTWRDGFKLQPTQPTTAEDFDANVELFVDGDISARLSDGGEFHADAIEGVMKPKKTTKPDGKESIMLVPEWFRAIGNVKIDTSALAAQTKTLDLLFVEPIPGQSKDRSPSSSNAIRQWVSQPGAGRTTVDPVARPRPVIEGDSIAAKLRLDTEGVSANDMSVRGAIKVTHVLKAGDQLLPATLTGERLRLINGGTDDVLQLESSPKTPARFELGDGYFVGPMIQILPNENLIRINAAGEFQMPSAALPTNLAGKAEAKIEWVQAPNCHWNGEMFFDGRTAVLTDGVDVKASLITDEGNWDLHMQGDRLQVDLAQAVQVRDMDSMKTATIQRIALLQSESTPVIVQALKRASDGVLEAKHLLHASVLALTPGEDGMIQAGQLVGRGPGWYRGWAIPSEKKSLLPLGGSDDRNPVTADSDAKKKLTGIHLVFHDSMRGDLAAKTLEFLRGVRVGVRAVAHWNDAFDAATMDAISMGDSTLDCDRLSFALTPQPKKPPNRLFPEKKSVAWEMEAVSGVVFRTRNERGLLEGTASRASYASSKDLFTVEGAPNRAAIFRQTLPNGRKGHEGAVRTMTLRPSTMEVQNMQWERLNIATPPELSGAK